MINKKDVDMLDNVCEILFRLTMGDENPNLDILNKFEDYITKQKVVYMNALDKKRQYINEKRKTNPMYARSKTEIEKYNALHESD